jgi:hypothetical protein
LSTLATVAAILVITVTMTAIATIITAATELAIHSDPQRFEGLTRATRSLGRKCYECIDDLLLGGSESRFGGGEVFLVLGGDTILGAVLGSRFTLALGTSN